jgi:hypothetical protein
VREMGTEPCAVSATKLLVRLGANIRVTSNFRGREHHATIPGNKQLKVGTLAEILNDVASYLDLTREELVQELFG